MLAVVALDGFRSITDLEDDVAELLAPEYYLEASSLCTERLWSVHDMQGVLKMKVYVTWWNNFECEVYLQSEFRRFSTSNVRVLQPVVTKELVPFWENLSMKLLQSQGGYIAALPEISEMRSFQEDLAFKVPYIKVPAGCGLDKFTSLVDFSANLIAEEGCPRLDSGFKSRSSRGYDIDVQDRCVLDLEHFADGAIAEKEMLYRTVSRCSWEDIFAKFGGPVVVSDFSKYAKAVEKWNRKQYGADRTSVFS